MPKVRLILPVLVVACAVGAVMAASASAVELEQYTIEGNLIPAGENVPLVVTNGTATLVGSGLEVVCTTVTSEGKFLAEGKSDEKAIFTNCTVVKPTGCTIGEPIELNMTDQALLFSGKPADMFSPKTGTTLTTLHYAGTGCSLTTLALTGHLQALIEKGGEELTEHELVFNGSSGEELEVGGSSATFKLKSKVKLGGTDVGKKFSAHMC